MSWFNRIAFMVWVATALAAIVFAIQDSARSTFPAGPAVSQSRKWQGHRFESRFLFGPSRRASFSRPIG